MSRVFIDGGAGTVGLALEPYLLDMMGEGLVRSYFKLAEEYRKDEQARKEAMAKADIVVLCLPDDVAVDAAAMAREVNPKVRILDASAAHRCHPEWVYGLADIGHKDDIRNAAYVANSGCFATACVMAANPLAQLQPFHPLMAFHGITGYSAAGRKEGDAPQGVPYLTQFGVEHRHLPEIAKYGKTFPTLTTMVGGWYQGLLVQTVVNLPEFLVMQCYQNFYANNPAVKVWTAQEMDYRVNPQACNGSNDVQIVVASQPGGITSVAVVLDNLGKGSAGNAAHNLCLMLEGQV